MQQSSAGVFTAIDAPLFPWVQNMGAYFRSFVTFIYLWMCIIFSTCTWLIDACSPSRVHSQKQSRRRVGNSCASQERDGRASLGTSVLQTLFVESLCMSMDYLWVHVSLCILEKGGGMEEGILLRLKVLWYSSMFKHVLCILQSASLPPFMGA